jgi:membrane-associated protein
MRQRMDRSAEMRCRQSHLGRSPPEGIGYRARAGASRLRGWGGSPRAGPDVRATATERTCVDVFAVCDALLHSSWLLPLLVVMIAVDGPFPMFPSETILMSAAAMAFGSGDATLVGALFVVAVAGSVLGDLLVFWLGRCSHRVLGRAVDAEAGLSAWVRRHLLLRTGVVLVGARFVPGGRLVSTAAAGRYGLALHRFLPWTVASSAAWSVYMLLIGLALGPITGGSPLLSLLAGAVIAVLTGLGFAVVGRVRKARASRATEQPVRVLVSS